VGITYYRFKRPHGCDRSPNSHCRSHAAFSIT
jgi:hypothetical protein